MFFLIGRRTGIMKHVGFVFTWAYAFVGGGALLITPAGIIPIVTNPGIRIVIGLLSIAVGLLGFNSWRKLAARAATGRE
jgi:hypothetical protein